ncbi:hypothetical protein HA402_010968 [Bradysia odoriphaga]|nr:hypothetical protein HA402_010968 [Bradysia odoriphaga]
MEISKFVPLVICLIGLLTGARARPNYFEENSIHDYHDHSVNVDNGSHDMHGTFYNDVHDHSINVRTGSKNIYGNLYGDVNDHSINIKSGPKDVYGDIHGNVNDHSINYNR